MVVNTELSLAHKLITSTGANLFLTGKAGTGKTTFLKQLKEESPKRMIVLAPTGIAAINANGMTIHSFFQLPFAPFIPDTLYRPDNKKQSQQYRFNKEKIKIIRSIDLLVIDEVSMVRADLLDAIDEVLRRYRNKNKPFGGVQLLMIGDLQQLAPVVKEDEWNLLKLHYDTPYFFSSHTLQQSEYYTIELTTVYRQRDEEFLKLLNSIRENKVNDMVIQTLNTRYKPYFIPQPEEGYIRLVTHNVQAQSINNAELAQLKEPIHTFTATIEGNFPEYTYPTEKILEFKVGSQVMFVKNDSSGEHRYYNGMIGEITHLTSHHIFVRSKESGEVINVNQEEWTNTHYVIDQESKEIREEVEGTFKQYPLKLAWAITIHKSQGLTFDKAIIDVSGSFAHGQVYVALSRCRTIDGIVLSAPLTLKAIICDNHISNFIDKIRLNIPNEALCYRLQQTYFLQILSELFDFDSLEWTLNKYTRFVAEHYSSTYPKFIESLHLQEIYIKEKIIEISRKFSLQYNHLVKTSSDYLKDEHIQLRIIAGAEYFASQLNPLIELTYEALLETDNKETLKRHKELYNELRTELLNKSSLLNIIHKNGFTTSIYLRHKTILLLNDLKSDKIKNKREKQPNIKHTRLTTADNIHPELFARLLKWRNLKAKELGLPAYTILQQKALLGISNILPSDSMQLASIAYIGQRSIDKYGTEILYLVDEYKKTKNSAF